MKKKTVLRVITRLNNGGPAKQAIWLSGLMDKRCFDTFLLAGESEHNEDDIFWYAGEYNVCPVVISKLRRSLTVWGDICSFIKILRIIIDIRPDIIHTHMSKAGLIGRAGAVIFNLFHRKKIIIIHTYHGHVFHSYFSSIMTRCFIYLERMLAKKTDILICISPRLKDEILRYMKIRSEKKIRIIPLGIDFSPPTKNRYREPQNRQLTIGMLGRLAPIKNYELAVEIAEVLAREKLPVRILIGGGGSDEALKKLRQSPLKNVTFLGNIPDSRKFWSAIDIAMITSKNEGTPVSLIEAMFAKIPFIATEVGGIPDMAFGTMKKEGNLLIYRNCILVRGFNPEDFVKGIRYYCDLETRKKAGDSGEKHGREQFSISRLIKDMETLYMQVRK